MFAVFSPGSPSTVTETIDAATKLLEEAGETETAARMKLYQSDDKSFGIAYDDVVLKGVDALSRCRTSRGSKGAQEVFTSSRLIRRMGDKVVARASMTTSDGAQCTDGDIIAQHVASIVSRIKWTKGRNVLRALRGMKMAGVQPRSSRRVSVTELNMFTPTPAAEGKPKEDEKPKNDGTPFLPESLAKEMCVNLNGPFAFVVYDSNRSMVFVARSADAQISGKNIAAPTLFWALDGLQDNQLIITTDKSLIPEHCAPCEILKNHYGWLPCERVQEVPKLTPFVAEEVKAAPAKAEVTAESEATLTSAAA